MKVRHENPPNIDQIRLRFDLSGFTPVFAYGDCLYNPSGQDISPDLMAHEEHHAQQQKHYRVSDWWSRYLVDDSFRFHQELEAFGEQYKFIYNKLDRHYRRQYLKEFAKQLSSKMYGNVTTKEQAEELIKNYVTNKRTS